MSYKDADFRHRLVDAIFSNWIVNGTYKKYIYSLGLKGDEKMLDFGSGSGAGSRHFAEILSKSGGHLTCLDISGGWMRIAKKRMRKHPHVDYVTDDIRHSNLPAGIFDVISIHIMLHDIDQKERPEIVEALTDKLKPGGRLFIREPIEEHHGMPVDEIRRLMIHNRLQENGFAMSKITFIGSVYSGKFIKS